MLHRFTRWRGLIGLLVVLFVASSPCPAPEPQLTAAQREEVTQLLAAFRKARKTPEDRAKVVGRLLEIGGPAVKQLLEVVQQEMRGGLEKYRELFHKQALAATRKRTKEADPAAVRTLQAKVLALKDRENLTEEMITQEADPALVELRKLALIDPASVLEGLPRLGEQRKALLALGEHWERCLQYELKRLPENAQKTAKPPKFEDYLRGEEQIGVQLAMPIPAEARLVMAANTRLTPKLDSEEGRAILACNLTRILLGLRPLEIDLRLAAAARDHSADMERLKFFDHESPVPGKKEFTDRAKNFGTTSSGENIAAGMLSGVTANDEWFHSPGHHKNMLREHKRIGIGRSGVYFTEMFGN
jgi:uncharacterized protein YkwD